MLDATAGSDAGIDVVSSEYATVAAEQTAQERLAAVSPTRWCRGLRCYVAQPRRGPMKAVKASLARALEQPDPAIRFYLFHGPDEAGSRALAMQLLKGLGDAEKFIVLGQSVKSDPAALADEAGAMALFGGKRAIWVEPAGDEIADGVAALLEAPASESAVIALAGSLRKTSALLKLAEAHPAALVALLLRPRRARHGAGRDRAWRGMSGCGSRRTLPQRIAAAANNNQAIAAQELAKFALYLGADPANSARPRP